MVDVAEEVDVLMVHYKFPEGCDPRDRRRLFHLLSVAKNEYRVSEPGYDLMKLGL